MSGAEAAIAGVGLLCSAIQIVTFGRDILQVYCQVRDGRSPDPRLEAYLKSAEDCFNQMNASASAAAQVQPLNTDQQQIVKVGQELHDCMDKLQSKFVELHLDEASKRGLRGKMLMAKKTLKSLWQSKELGSLEENLKRYESLLHGIVLHRICNQSQAAEIKSTEAFNKLNTDLQSFITQLADGRTKLSELLLTSMKIRDRVTQEHEKTRLAMDKGFTSTQGTISGIRDSMSQCFQDTAQRELSRDLERHHERLLESLRFSEMNSRKNNVLESYRGTFSWVFKDPRHDILSRSLSDGETNDEDTNEGDVDDDITMDDAPESAPTTDSPNSTSFTAWLESDLNLFWISGKPASGKSSLMKFLASNSLTIKHLKVWQRNTQTTNHKLHIITHYFWKPGQLLQRNVKGMMLSLLHQVLRKDPYLARRLWEDQGNVSDKRACGDWDPNELREALSFAIKSSSDAFCIFLDWLDEAKELESIPWRDNRNTQVIHDLLCLANVKLCASSREEHPFCLFFRDRPRLRIHQLTYDDIYHFAENRLELSGLKSSDRGQILRTIVRKANGVFLWVTLVLDSLNRAIRSGTASYDEYQERLAQTPADLNDLLIDMWERPGDDAKLSSYRIDASRYFSLAITANKLEEDIGNTDPELQHNSIRSLLVMATALEDEPLTSILDTGRYIQAKDLQARCARVADRLQLISRGLLEITTTPITAEFDEFEGTPRLSHYDFKRVEFIHRSAFDFITDTQFGRDCLSTCHWSSIEQVDRLLGGHLVRCRFLCSEPIPSYIGMQTDIMTYKMMEETSSQLQRALKIFYHSRRGDLSFTNDMLRTLKDWQECGLGCAHSYWNYPQGSKEPSNPLALEFLERVVVTAPRFTIITGLLDGLSIGPLVDAIPVLLRGVAQKDLGVITTPRCWELIGYILTRLTKSSEKRQGVYYQTRASVRSTTLLLHSWFVIQCLHNISFYNDAYWLVILDLLDRFRNTLASTDDWEHPFILSFGEGALSQFCPKGLYYCEFSSYFTVAIVNFVTAYRILGRLVQERLCCTLHTQAPQGTSERFEIVLISGKKQSRWGYAEEMFSPATEYYHAIADHLENVLFEMHSSKDSNKREEAWEVFLQSISGGLTSVGDDGMGYCMRELAKRGFEFPHPWYSNWVVKEGN